MQIDPICEPDETDVNYPEKRDLLSVELELLVY